MRKLLAVVLALPVVAACGTARTKSARGPATTQPDAGPARSAATDPCRGSDLDLDAIATECVVRERRRPAPPAHVLRMELEPAVVTVEPGGQVELFVRMINTGDEPLEVDIALGCTAFTTHVLDASGRRVDWRDDCGVGLGLCGTGWPVRVTLEPAGSLRKVVTFIAVTSRLVESGGQCEQAVDGPLAPGEYTLRLISPHVDPIPGRAHEIRPRHVEVPLHVR